MGLFLKKKETVPPPEAQPISRQGGDLVVSGLEVEATREPAGNLDGVFLMVPLAALTWYWADVQGVELDVHGSLSARRAVSTQAQDEVEAEGQGRGQ
jgi:hypothetical protein